MAKKKTSYAWLILVLSGLAIIALLVSSILISVFDFFLDPVIKIVEIILPLTSVVILIIFFLKLFNVKSDLVKWTHLMFGYSIFQLIAGLVVSYTSIGSLALFGIVPLIFGVIVEVILWATFVGHLRRAQRENLMDFS